MARVFAVLALVATCVAASGTQSGAALQFSTRVAAASALQLPKNATKQEQVKIITSLESQVSKLETNIVAIKTMDKHDKTLHKDSKALQAGMKGNDAAMMTKFDEWDHRMNQKTRVGAMNVLSNLKNCIHFIKKGALSGDKDAASGLDKVMEAMGSLVGKPADGKAFLH